MTLDAQASRLSLQEPSSQAQRRMVDVRIDLPRGPAMVEHKKYYVITVGRQPGIFVDWIEVSNSVLGFPGAKYKSYPTLQEAIAVWQDHVGRAPTAPNEVQA
ncbi:hypothetical protein BDN72DRAFT_904471 [Pluteus cervinus]|uniref:Uncharacterized protein n=1 Tax=Pluteus cervinus TaxID=181527 RepID=A0ACD3A874_9AGAR|nr:hypothetical protein BDN72DRAFT_904471 [Pluteus cervinus]